MNGLVDKQGRALLEVFLMPSESSDIVGVEVWIDTGFNGDLVLPQCVIEELGLPLVGTVQAVLADGNTVSLKTHACWIDWFNGRQYLEVVANEGEFPLMGIGLMWGRDLQVSYRTNDISLT